MTVIIFRFQAASRHHGIGCAHTGRFPEGRADVELIVLRKVRTVNDVDDFLLMLLPIRRRLPVGNGVQQIGQSSIPQEAVFLFQHVTNYAFVLIVQFPKEKAAGIFPAARVRHVEHIMDLWYISRDIHQGDPLGAAPHIPAHGVVPQIEARTGRGVRPLRVDHQLLMIRVFVEAGGCPQEGCPCLVAARNLPRSIFGHLRVGQCFIRHSVAPFS